MKNLKKHDSGDSDTLVDYLSSGIKALKGTQDKDAPDDARSEVVVKRELDVEVGEGGSVKQKSKVARRGRDLVLPPMVALLHLAEAVRAAVASSQYNKA